MVTVCTGMSSSRKNRQVIYLQSTNFVICITNICLFASILLGQVTPNTGTEVKIFQWCGRAVRNRIVLCVKSSSSMALQP